MARDIDKIAAADMAKLRGMVQRHLPFSSAVTPDTVKAGNIPANQVVTENTAEDPALEPDGTFTGRSEAFGTPPVKRDISLEFGARSLPENTSSDSVIRIPYDPPVSFLTPAGNIDVAEIFERAVRDDEEFIQQTHRATAELSVGSLAGDKFFNGRGIAVDRARKASAEMGSDAINTHFVEFEKRKKSKSKKRDYAALAALAARNMAITRAATQQELENAANELGSRIIVTEDALQSVEYYEEILEDPFLDPMMRVYYKERLELALDELEENLEAQQTQEAQLEDTVNKFADSETADTPETGEAVGVAEESIENSQEIAGDAADALERNDREVAGPAAVSENGPNAASSEIPRDNNNNIQPDVSASDHFTPSSEGSTATVTGPPSQPAVAIDLNKALQLPTYEPSS